MKPPVHASPLQDVPVTLPLAVDLDGTLVDGDLFKLALQQLLRRAPLRAVGCLARWPLGRAAVKAAVARAQPLDMAQLPLRAELLDLIRRQRAAGRTVVLATAADTRHAHALADAWPGLFSDVLASHAGHNLKGGAKAQALQQRYPQGFVYAGDSQADLPVWAAARAGLVVHAQPALWQQALRQATRLGTPLWRLPDSVEGSATAARSSPKAESASDRSQLLRFLFWGALAAAVNALTRAALSASATGLPFAAAVVLAHGVAMAVAFWGYRRYVWPHSRVTWRQQLLGFVSVNAGAGGVVLLVSQSLWWMATGLVCGTAALRPGESACAGSEPAVQAFAHCTGLAVAAAFSFAAHRRWTFGGQHRP